MNEAAPVKVLGISTSPRAGGNTDLLLDAVLDGAASRGARVERPEDADTVFSVQSGITPFAVEAIMADFL